MRLLGNLVGPRKRQASDKAGRGYLLVDQYKCDNDGFLVLSCFQWSLTEHVLSCFHLVLGDVLLLIYMDLSETSSQRKRDLGIRCVEQTDSKLSKGLLFWHLFDVNFELGCVFGQHSSIKYIFLVAWATKWNFASALKQLISTSKSWYCLMYTREVDRI
jgi:hypothetical protein